MPTNVPVEIGLDWRVLLVDTTGTQIGTNPNPLVIAIASGGTGSAVSAVDQSAFTAGVNAFDPVGGVFNDSVANLASGTSGEARLTAARAFHVNLRDAAGVQFGTVGNPIFTTATGGGSAVTGTKTSNTVVPGATNLGVLPAVANAAAPTYTETFQVLLSTDLSGNLRVITAGTTTVGGTVTANAGTGTFTTAGNLTNNNAAPGATNLGVLPALANAAPPTWTEGDQVLLSTNLAGSLRVVAIGTTTVSGTVTANAGTGTFTTAGTLTNNNAAPAATNLGVLPALANASAPTYTEGDQVLLSTNLAGSLRVLTVGTTTVSGTITANAGTGTFTSAGTKTNNNAAPDGGNIGVLPALANAVAPTWTEGDLVLESVDLKGNQRVLPAGTAIAFGSAPTSVAAGATVPEISTRQGILFTIGGHPNVITVRATFSTAQTNTVIVANSAGTKIIVTGFLIDVDNATTVNTLARIGLAQTVTPTTTGVFGSHPGIAPGSGIARGSGSGIIGVGADGDQILFTCGAPTSGNIDCVVTYFTVPT